MNMTPQSNSSWSQSSQCTKQTIDKFVMTRPNKQIQNLSINIKDELEHLRKELIETFFQSAMTHIDIIIKRKLGILTEDVCDYYRFQKKPNSISPEEFNVLPKLQFNTEQNSTDPLNSFQHTCVTCPFNLVSVDDTPTSSSWSHVYMCDICHCTRALENNMNRHLDTELHLSATKYLTDSATMILNHCVRRSCVQMNEHDKNTFDSTIICPICYEPFSSVNSCAIHSNLSHNIDYIYSIAYISQTFDLIIKRDHDCMECGEQFKKLPLLIKHLVENSHGPHETNTSIPLFLCPINECYYRTKRFFNFKTHLMLMHSNSFHSIDGTIQVKIKLLNKPRSYMHITRFLHKNQTDIDEELKALEELEYDMKDLPNNTKIIKIIKTRYDMLRNL